MRKFILVAGFVLVSAAAQAGDRSLSLGSTTSTAAPPAKAIEAPRTAEAPQAVEAPKYVERPAVVEPKTETSKAETSKGATSRSRAAARMQRPAAASVNAEPTRPAARRAALASRMAQQRRRPHGIAARIIYALHRHGIYW